MTVIAKFSKLLPFVGIAFGALHNNVPYTNTSVPYKFIPGDARWPSVSRWENLNRTVSGRLIKTVPLPSVCHSAPFGTYNQEKCAQIQEGWTEEIYL